MSYWQNVLRILKTIWFRQFWHLIWSDWPKNVNSEIWMNLEIGLLIFSFFFDCLCFLNCFDLSAVWPSYCEICYKLKGIIMTYLDNFGDGCSVKKGKKVHVMWNHNFSVWVWMDPGKGVLSTWNGYIDRHKKHAHKTTTGAFELPVKPGLCWGL